MRKQRLVTGVAGAVMFAGVLVGCGDSGDPVTAPPPDAAPSIPSPPTSEAPQMASCVASERGYALGFPASWFTNDAGVAEPCRFFHPEPFTLAPQTEATGIAISVRLNPVAFDEMVPSAEGWSVMEMLDRRTTTLDGRRAVRAETRSTGRALLSPGTHSVTWFVDASDATLVATTSEAAAAGRYGGNVAVLDRMMQSLRIFERPSTCSAGRTTPSPTLRPEVPQAVAAMRTAIIQAARACDYDKLADLALAGDMQFTYSFGGGGRPAAFWKAAEAEGRAPLRSLVEILDGPAASRSVGANRQYLWPAAYGYERWDDVPASAREDLARLYGAEDLRRFEQFGSYVGYRVGITEDGDWIFFVSGD